MFRAAFIVFFLFFNAFSAMANTPQNNIIPPQFKNGHYSLGTELNYFSTSANYDDTGSSSSLPSGFGYSAFQTLLYGRFDYTNNLSFFSDMGLNYAMSENNLDKRSAFKISGITFGANYDLGKYYFKLIPEVKGYFAVEKFDTAADEVLTSDGTHSVDFGLHAFKKFWDFQFHSYLSYQYRFDGFSSLLNYQFDLTYLFENLVFSFGLKGFQTVGDDENANNPLERHLTLSNVNGASLMYGSVNPSRTDLFISTKYPWNDSIDIYGAVNKSIGGENTADYLNFNIGFEYFFEPISKTKSFDYKNYDEDQDFEYEDENIDPKVEEEIKSYNKPNKQISKKIKRTGTKKEPKNELSTSKKELGKFKSKFKKPSKSSRKKRVKVDF